VNLSKCKYSIYISAYADGELPEGKRAFLERHLATCPHCQQALEEVKYITSLLQGRKVFSHPAEDILSEKILAAVRASSQTPPLLARRAFQLGALCVVMLLAFLCLFNLKTTTVPSTYARLDELYAASSSIEYVESDVGAVLTFDSQEGKFKVIWILEDTGGMTENDTNGNRA